MKKQEMHPDKDQHRGSDRSQAQDKSSKTKSQMEDRTHQKSSRMEDSDEDRDFSDFEKQSSQRGAVRQQSSDKKMKS